MCSWCPLDAVLLNSGDYCARCRAGARAAHQHRVMARAASTCCDKLPLSAARMDRAYRGFRLPALRSSCIRARLCQRVLERRCRGRSSRPCSRREALCCWNSRKRSITSTSPPGIGSFCGQHCQLAIGSANHVIEAFSQAVRARQCWNAVTLAHLYGTLRYRC